MDMGTRTIADALRAKTCTTCIMLELQLSGKDSGDRGMQAIAHVLRSNSKLQKVKMGYNSIGDVGGEALADVLRRPRRCESFC